MAPLGRYASHYNRPGYITRPPPVQPFGNIGENSDLVDIADAEFQKFRIHCWPSSEHGVSGSRRRWGRRRGAHVAILPFRFRAGQTRCRVQNFELDVAFSAQLSDQLESISASDREIRLIELPVPYGLKGPRSICHKSQQPWAFSSEPITDEDGHARGARWVWIAHDHDPCVLHGAVVVEHSGQPFAMRCVARGEVTIPIYSDRPKIVLRLRFNSDDLGPRWWSLTPQFPDGDGPAFEQAIARLDAEIKSLHADDNFLHDTLPAGAQGIAHQYGDVNLPGIGALHQGDYINNFHF